MPNSATSQSLTPYEQTVGHLIDFVTEGIADNNATALAIKAQFGSYCDCSMAQWIIDGINNAGSNPTVINKLRQLLAADPYAVIEKTLRLSPPEKLMKRYCSSGQLMGTYMDVTGTEINQVLGVDSALCPPAETEEPVEFYIKDSLREAGAPSGSDYSDRTIVESNFTARAEFPITGPDAFWGTTTPTQVKITLTTPNDGASYRILRIDFNGTFMADVQVYASQPKEWVGYYVTPPGIDYLYISVVSIAYYMTSQNTLFNVAGSVAGFTAITLTPSNPVTFTQHIPEIGLGYMVRSNQVMLNASGATNAKVEEESSGLSWYGRQSARFTSDGLRFITTNLTDATTIPDFLNMDSNHFPPTHFNRTNIPQTNIETGITVFVPVSNDNYPDEGNWPGATVIALVFDTDGVASGSNYNVGASYESGYGSAVIVKIGNDSYGPTMEAKLLSRRPTHPDDNPKLSKIIGAESIFERAYWDIVPVPDKYEYQNSEIPLLSRIRSYQVLNNSNPAFYQYKLSVKIYHGHLALFVNDVAVYSLNNYGVPYNASTSQSLRCGFYVGSFSYENNYYKFTPNKGYLKATDYYVKPFTLEGIQSADIQLVWAEDPPFNGLTLAQRTSNKSIVVGDVWQNAPAFDTHVSASPAFMMGYKELNFTLSTATLNYEHIKVRLDAYEVLPDGTTDLLFSRPVAFDSVSHEGNFEFEIGTGFTPTFWRNEGGSLWDNDTWWMELVITYKGFTYGKITIIMYAPHSQQTGAYLYGAGWMAMSKMQFT